MSLFPFMDPHEVPREEIEESPMAREWAWDFDKLDFKIKNGNMYLVEGKEAVKIWIWKVFQTPRYRYLVYSWDYGHELEELIGKGFTHGLVQAEAERIVREAIWPTLEGYVTDINNLTVGFADGVLSIAFTAVTPYGEVKMSV